MSRMRVSAIAEAFLRNFQSTIVRVISVRVARDFRKENAVSSTVTGKVVNSRQRPRGASSNFFLWNVSGWIVFADEFNYPVVLPRCFAAVSPRGSFLGSCPSSCYAVVRNRKRSSRHNGESTQDPLAFAVYPSLVRSDSVLLGFFGELPRHVRRSFWFRVDRRIYPFFGRKLHRSAGRRRWRSSIEKWPCEKLELHRQKFGSFEPCASRARVEFMLARTNFGRVWSWRSHRCSTMSVSRIGEFILLIGLVVLKVPLSPSFRFSSHELQLYELCTLPLLHTDALLL